MSTSREIKFRAWDDFQQRYVFEGFHIVGEVTCFGGMEEVISDTWQARRVAKQYETTIEAWNDFTFEQYTGLNDSKGRPIYEGDIMASRGNYMTDECDEDGNYPDLHNVVVWSTAYTRFGLLPVDEYANVIKSGGDPRDQYLWVCSLTTFREVIGNVRQNPELLVS